jgi:AraC family transcriptional regulator of adaptative response/methylated-DNA-[protein]-cysteine methyltransferase
MPQTAHPVSDTIHDARWAAVLQRDRSADGTFVYAVRSTGIFCRPSCPSRRPSRAQVTFYGDGGDAARAGFRACKRCRPMDPAAADPWADRIRRACVYLANVSGHISLPRLAARLGGSSYHLQRNFKRLVGVSPREFAEACRLRRVKQRLRAGAPVTMALFDAGYGSTGRFYERAAPKFGMTPHSYRQGAAGARIRYVTVDAAVGRLLVAATDRGVCAVTLGTDEQGLERSLRAEFPAATLIRDQRALAVHVKKIVDHLEGRMSRGRLPLDIEATAFQWRVWEALTKIPYGETRTYGEVAAAIGRPGASRAVARACASNQVALLIPCHRVVPASGGTGGYRWGTARKRAILAAERRRSRIP